MQIAKGAKGCVNEQNVNKKYLCVACQVMDLVRGTKASCEVNTQIKTYGGKGEHCKKLLTFTFYLLFIWQGLHTWNGRCKYGFKEKYKNTHTKPSHIALNTPLFKK